jgi:hypothetical protein
MSLRYQTKLHVLFVRYEDKVKLLNSAFKPGDELMENSGIKLKRIEVENDSLLYSWGSSRNGKLGIKDYISQDYEASVLNNFFVCDNVDQVVEDIE